MDEYGAFVARVLAANAPGHIGDEDPTPANSPTAQHNLKAAISNVCCRHVGRPRGEPLVNATLSSRADDSSTTLPRLLHVVRRLEDHGLVEPFPCRGERYQDRNGTWSSRLAKAAGAMGAPGCNKRNPYRAHLPRPPPADKCRVPFASCNSLQQGLLAGDGPTS